MAKKKRDRKKSGRKKSESRKKVSRKGKPIQPKEPARSKVPSGSSSTQMHRGVGSETAGQAEIAREIFGDTDEFGGES
jgi:hypothetical protein